MRLLVLIALLTCISIQVSAKSSVDFIRERFALIDLSPAGKKIKSFFISPSSDFRSPSEEIDYFNSQNWYVFGEKNPISKYIPEKLKDMELKDKKVAVFYLHPAIYWGPQRWNTKINDSSNKIVENLLLVNHASIFAACCDVFVPKRRSASLPAFVDKSGSGEKAALLDYADSKAAFEAFLEINKDKPFILAGHSGGSGMMALLINDFQKTDEFKRLIAAYLPGWSIRNNHFENLEGCKNPEQTKCYLSWSTTMHNTTSMFKDEENLFCSNPITGKQGNESIPFEKSLGAMSFADYAFSDIRKEKDRQLKKLNGYVSCENGSLIIKDNPLSQFPSRFFNLHSYDYGLFYGDIMKDSLNRVGKFFQ